MKIVEQGTTAKIHPSKLVKMGCINFTFNTGHKATVWIDGVAFYKNKSGNALNEKTGSKIIPEMKNLISKILEA